MYQTKIKILIALLSGISIFSYALAYWDIAIDSGAWCEVVEEIVEVIEEPWCSDPFFQDIEYKATEEIVPMEEVVFDDPIDVEIPLNIEEKNVVIEEIVIEKTYNHPVKKDIPFEKKIMEKKVDTVIITDKQDEADVVVIEEVIEEVINEAIIEEVIINEVVLEQENINMLDETEKTILDKTHESAQQLPNNITIAYIFTHHSWEVIFIAFIIFLLFSLLFI